ncbi:MAG: ATP-binding protein [Bacilli bacterium]
MDYYKKKKFYDNLFGMLNKLDKKYLVLETLDVPSSYEEKLISDILYDIDKSMIENINEHYKKIFEFKEYLELWIHEVKIPISSIVLKCHNHKKINSNDLLSIIRRLDNDIDRVLYLMRSDSLEKDFLISEVSLKEVVRNVNLKNKDDLLENNIKLDVNINNVYVSTDKKWLEFILNQIINNSIKYRKKSNSIIKIECVKEKDKVKLSIYDNGIGICKGDIDRVFDKFFTGINGREKVKSTGMGLYIIKKLCDKLGHNIYIESVLDEYTKVTLEFGKNDLYDI